MDGGRRRLLATMVCAVLALGTGVAYATHMGLNPIGFTTLQKVVEGPNPDDGFAALTVTDIPDASHLVRDKASEGDNLAIPAAKPGRETRRTSLSYFAQFSDFQLADEESPARVEFLDPGANSAWRPQEAFTPFMVDAAVRQVNDFTDESPVEDGNGDGAEMDFALLTGDLADSNQRNENVWVRDLIEGNVTTNFNSGIDPDVAYQTAHPSCVGPGTSEGPTPKYTGVQDRADFLTPPGTAYYDPNIDDASGPWDDWPVYPGLLDRAQSIEITPEGLDVPAYVAKGNHDTLVQGNEDANAPFESVALGCFKAIGNSTPVPPPFEPDPNLLFGPLAAGIPVPPDPLRRFTSKRQVKAIYGQNDPDAHGFDFVDMAENDASNNSASYYAWNPPEAPGFRFIALDTNSEGGQTAEGVGSGSANGNIDDPQFQWLKGQLDDAKAADELVVLFGHHPVRSLNTEIVDEQASKCTTTDGHGDTPEHDVNPGCDADPRSSVPIHLGQDAFQGDPRQSLVELLDGYSNVVTYVAGHTHENKVTPFVRGNGTVWWGIESAAEIDWPTQTRLIEVMDNEDGTLSIFGTLLDQASSADTPAPGPAAAFDGDDLASLGRTFAYNDPQAGDGSGEGVPADQNVELLVFDPRIAGDPDADGDGIPNAEDNCPGIANPDQSVNPCAPPASASPAATPTAAATPQAKCKKRKAKRKRGKASTAKKKRKKRCKARKKRKKKKRR